MKILRKLLVLILWVFGLWVLIETLDVMRRLNFAEEIPELLWYQWTWLHWVFLAASALVTMLWSYKRTRAIAAQSSTTLRLYVFGFVPAAAAVVLFLPSLLAAPKVYFQTDVLDCTAIKIPGYVPDMVDYSWLVLDTLTTGATLGLSMLADHRMAKCTAHAASPFAMWFVIILRLAAALVVVLTLLLLWRAARARLAPR